MKRIRRILTLVLLLTMISALAVSVNARYIREYSTTTDENETIQIKASMQGYTLLDKTRFYRSYATIRFDPIAEGVAPDYMILDMTINVLAYGGSSVTHSASGEVEIGGYLSCQNYLDYAPEQNILYLEGTYSARVLGSNVFINPPAITISGYDG